MLAYNLTLVTLVERYSPYELRLDTQTPQTLIDRALAKRLFYTRLQGKDDI